MSDLGNREIFSRNLRYYMTINQKTRNDMCKALDFKYTTFTDWYNGNIYPGIDKIEKIANYFRIEKSDLIENKEKNKTDVLGNEVVPIPLLGTVKAGYNYLAQENWEGTVDVEQTLVGDGSEFFALKVKGDSMFPDLKENDVVIIKKQSDFENGDIIVAIINGDEATIKKGRKSEAGILLQPLNPKYEPLIFTHDDMKNIPVAIVGVVKQLKREF